GGDRPRRRRRADPGAALQRLPGVAGMGVHPHHAAGRVRQSRLGLRAVGDELLYVEPQRTADDRREPATATDLRDSLNSDCNYPSASSPDSGYQLAPLPGALFSSNDSTSKTSLRSNLGGSA